MNDNLTSSSLQSGTGQSLSSFAILPSSRNPNDSHTKGHIIGTSKINVIDEFNDQNADPLMMQGRQRDLRLENYFSNQNVEPPRSMASNRNINQTYQSAGTSQAQQKNFTFNETVSSQPKQLLSTQRSNILDIANRQSPINQDQYQQAKNFLNNQGYVKQGFDYQGQQHLSTPQSLLGTQIISQEQTRNSTQLQRFQQHQPTLKSHQEMQLPAPQVGASLSASSAKSGVQGISQSLMQLGRNREKLQQTQSVDQLSKQGTNSKSPSQHFQPTQIPQEQVNSYGYYIQPFTTTSSAQQQQHYPIQIKTPTNFAAKIMDQRGARSSSGNRGRNIELPNSQINAFQQQRHSQVDPYNSGFFFNTRQYKRNNHVQNNKRLNLIVPITSNSLVVDDYNTNNYSTVMGRRLNAQGFSTGHKQSRNANLYSPGTQPVFQSQQKAFRPPMIPPSALGMAQSQQSLVPQNISVNTQKSDLESVKKEIMRRRQEQLEREEILNQLDQELLSSQGIDQTRIRQHTNVEISELDSVSSKDSDVQSNNASNFQTSSETEVKRQKRQQQRQRYRQANERRKVHAPSSNLHPMNKHQQHTLDEDDNGIILITADNEDYSNNQPTHGNRPYLRIHPQYVNTESSAGQYYTSESQGQENDREILNKNTCKKQIKLRRQAGQFNLPNQKHTKMNQVQEIISKGGYSSSKNHSHTISNASSIRFDTRQKSQTPLYCCRGQRCAIF